MRLFLEVHRFNGYQYSILMLNFVDCICDYHGLELVSWEGDTRIVHIRRIQSFLHRHFSFEVGKTSSPHSYNSDILL